MNLTNVIVVENPLKTLKVTGKVTDREEKICVRVPEHYINLGQGTWTCSLDYIVASSVKHRYNSIYNISTTLLSGITFETVPGTNIVRPKTDHAIIGHLNYTPSVTDSLVTYMYQKLTPQWFLIETSDRNRFEIFLSENQLVVPRNREFLPNEFFAEIGFMFRRLQ